MLFRNLSVPGAITLLFFPRARFGKRHNFFRKAAEIEATKSCAVDIVIFFQAASALEGQLRNSHEFWRYTGIWMFTL